MLDVRALILGLAAGALLLAACESRTTVVSGGPDLGGISVNGTGTVTVTPDLAQLSLGVEATARTVAEAREQAARALEAVRDSLRRNGIQDRDVQTRFVSIQPQYSSPPFDPARPVPPDRLVITGYMVTNLVTVKVRNLDQVSQVLDQAVAAGGDATRVNGIQFTVDEPERHYAEARELAMRDARETAESLARLAGVDLGPPRSISENRFGGPTPVFDRAQAAPPGLGGETPTPIDPGETEIQLQVNVVFEVR